MKKTVRRAVFALALVLVLSVSALAAGNGFTIHKTDEAGKPLAGAGFEVYGKPEMTEETATETETEPETEPALTEVTVTKVWKDGSDAEGLRPDSAAFAACLHLYAGEEEVADAAPEITETDKNTWTVIWKDLPENDAAGAPIRYTVREDAVEGYETSGAPAENGGTITNTVAVSLHFYKVWTFYDKSYAKDCLVAAEAFADYVDLWVTTDPAYQKEHPENLSQDAYKKLENAPRAEVTQDYCLGGGKEYRYLIRYNGLPKYDDSGAPLHYTLRENHLVSVDLFGGFSTDCLAIGFSPFGEDYNRLLTYEEMIALGYSEREAREAPFVYSDCMPITATPTVQAFFGVGEGGTLKNATARVLDGAGGLIGRLPDGRRPA